VSLRGHGRGVGEKMSKKRKDLTLISLFTGCAGLDLGFEEQGFETLVCVDNDYEACKTLRFNRPEWEVHEGDIANFSTSGRKATGVIGGPPCQGFSTAGKGNPDDPRNMLWQQYFRVVSDVLPDFILLENVPGMLHSKNRAHLDDLLASFEALGYVVSYDVLNAADYGVPQNRRRLIVIGGRGFSIPFPEPAYSTPVTVREAISDLGSSTTAANHQPNSHAPHVVERWKKLAEGETDPGYRRSRLYADKPSCTIRAGGGYGPRGDHLGGFHPPIHYELPRQLTVRESARIQGFPDHWILKGSKTAQGRQIGNAVAPPLASALAKTIRRSLETHWSGKPQTGAGRSGRPRQMKISFDERPTSNRGNG